jgi:hypothetical protein
MYDTIAIPVRAELFILAKTMIPIPARAPALRDARIQQLKSVSGDRDPTAAVTLLACANLLYLDLLALPLSPVVLVRCYLQRDNA